MRKKISFRLLIIIIICFFIIIITLTNSNIDESGDVTVVFHTDKESISFTCTVAETLEEKQQGLRGVEDLAMKKGMLFVYDSMQPLVFTMIEMSIPLDIIFINDQLTITHIISANIGQQNIKSNGPAQYVVEINQGLTDQYQISIGTSVDIIQRKE